MFSLIRRYFSFYRLRRAHPTLSDYVSTGLGIEARRSRCARYWDPHLRYSREFINRQFESLVVAESSIAVLGAGRLHDIDWSLLDRFQKVDLYDLDPGCARAWRAFDRSLQRALVCGHLIDLSGCIEQWTKALKDFLSRESRTHGAIAEFLRQLPARAPASRLAVGSDFIVSLNLFGQLGIYWSDRVESLLADLACITTDSRGNLSPELESALHATVADLEKRHLDLLVASEPKKIILLTDESYLWYTPQAAMFQEAAALVTGVPAQLPGYRLTAADGWWWHIGPRPIESYDEGEIHEVRALCFERGAAN